MSNKLTIKSNPKEILKLFRNCKDTESVNLPTEKGHIYKAGGLLCKLEGNNHFFAHKNKWVRLEY